MKKQEVIVAYCRLIDDYSIALQKNEIQKFANENKIEISKWYVDEKVINGLIRRSDFQKMINAGKRKRFSQVLVYKTIVISKFKINFDCYSRILRQNQIEIKTIN